MSDRQRERGPDIGLPRGRGVRVAIITATALLGIGAVGFVLFGFNAWSLMAAVVGGPVLVVAGILRLFEWGSTAARLRRIFTGIGWISVVGGVAQLGLAAVRLFNTTIVVDVVFTFLGGTAGLAMGLIILRALRAASQRLPNGEGRAESDQPT
jgi:hypothetical protein